MGKDYKVVVIGSGAAGTTAGMMLAKSKLKTAIVESDKWGGSTLNTRDVPYAAGLNFAHSYMRAKEDAKMGLSSGALNYNYPTAINWRNGAVKRSGGNNQKVFENNGLTCLKGIAHFVGPYELSVGEQTITAEKFILATGAVLDRTGITGVETVKCLTPNTALGVTKLPKAVMVVGGGSTGCEIAQYFAELGVKVLIAESANRILPKEDREAGEMLGKYLTDKLHVKVLTASRVVAVEEDAKSKKVIMSIGGKEKSVRVDAIVLATGSRPMLDLGLENAGIKLNPDGGIKVDSCLQTSSRHIWAVGDILGGESSTERAVYEASLVAANLINNGKAIVNYNGFMRVTNTSPRIAKVGMNEMECSLTRQKVKTITAPITIVSRSNTTGERYGFLKLIANRKDVILGATAMMQEADLVLQELALAIRHGLTLRELAGTPHVANNWGELVRVAAKELANRKK